MYTYTKQEVQEFLGTTNNKNDDLINSLATRGIEAETNNRRGANLRFKLNKAMVDPIVEEFGFKPRRPNTTRTLLKVFQDFDGALNMSWAAVSEYIKETYGENIPATNLSTAYRELVENDKATPIDVSVLVDRTGEVINTKQELIFHKHIQELTKAYDYYLAYQFALSKFDLTRVKSKEISAY